MLKDATATTASVKTVLHLLLTQERLESWIVFHLLLGLGTCLIAPLLGAPPEESCHARKEGRESGRKWQSQGRSWSELKTIGIQG